MNRVGFPQSRCRCGVARRDITPPVGMYHRMWGAATHDRSTGVHRRLTATALVIAPIDTHAGRPHAIVAIDHCLMWADDGHWLRQTVARQSGFDPQELQIAFSHTHAAGLLGRERAHLPGGELIEPYLAELAERMAEAITEAMEQLQPASIVYGTGRCDLAHHRDYWDDARQQYVCGFNPGHEADDTLLVAKITRDDGKTVGTIVNYACHPTTLAWGNTQISPDYVGAMRELVESATGAPCVFLQGASGELGPREGYVGDTRIADRNGRQLGYAALSIVESLPPARCDFVYQRAVVSGAILGDWDYEPVDSAAEDGLAAWSVQQFDVELPYRADLPTLQATDDEIERLSASAQNSTTPSNGQSSRDRHARMEQLVRQRRRLTLLPQGQGYPFPVTLWRLGRSLWLFVESEHYSYLQRELRRQFPELPILVTTVANFWRAAYLPTADVYGKGIYQETIAVLAPGCLESLVEAIAARMSELVERTPAEKQPTSISPA